MNWVRRNDSLLKAVCAYSRSWVSSTLPEASEALMTAWTTDTDSFHCEKISRERAEESSSLLLEASARFWLSDSSCWIRLS